MVKIGETLVSLIDRQSFRNERREQDPLVSETCSRLAFGVKPFYLKARAKSNYTHLLKGYQTSGMLVLNTGC